MFCLLNELNTIDSNDESLSDFKIMELVFDKLVKMQGQGTLSAIAIVVGLIADGVIKVVKSYCENEAKHREGERIFDKKELALYLKIPVTWIDKKVSLNEIPYHKVGRYVRFRKGEIDKWFEKLKINYPLMVKRYDKGNLQER